MMAIIMIKAINIAPNTAVTQEIADALHDASDHLPVVVDIVFSNEIVYASRK